MKIAVEGKQMITGEMIAHLKKKYAEAGAEEERLRSMSGSRLTEYIIEQYHQPLMMHGSRCRRENSGRSSTIMCMRCLWN